MSKNIILKKYTHDENFKHKRREYGYFGKGDIIEIGWRGVFLDILLYLKGGSK